MRSARTRGEGRTTPHLLIMAGGLLLGLTSPAHAEEGPEVSNGGYMKAFDGKDSKGSVLPLRHTGVDAEVSGAVASVQVTQVFENPSKQPIEAVYVFPLPHRAAIYSMRITVGQRVIAGVVKKREDARIAYNKAKEQGKTAALLEQERPNIFTQSVANILPGEQIKVEISYVEDLLPEGNRYEFVFPMVVGPRYVGGGQPLQNAGDGGGRAGWAEDSDRIPDASRITPRLLRAGKRPGNDISVRLRIHGGIPIRHLQVVTHKAAISTRDTEATVVLDPADSIPNKDFVARYQLAGEQPEVGLLVQRDARGGHLLLMVQPMERMGAKDISPREYIFVVDNSGSMYGFPSKQARAVMQRCLKNMRQNDTFNIIRFAGTPDQLAPRPLFASMANIDRGMRYIAAMEGGGGTEFLPALKAALEAPKDPSRSRIVLFMTDGYIGYENEVLRYLRDHGNSSNIFALGVGSSVNRFLIDGMARIGQGSPFYLTNSEDASSVVERIFSTISRPALTHIDLEWEGSRVTDLSPTHIPDLFGDKPVVLVGRFFKGGQGSVTVRGRLAGKPFTRRIPLSLPHQPTPDNPAVAYLWARQTIAHQMDIHATEPDRQQAAEKLVTEIALAYNLMSRFTSFVAVDEHIRNLGQKPVRADQSIPLPEGVSELAAPAGAIRHPTRNAGVLGLLGSRGGSEPASIFGKDSAHGADSEDALGGLIGSEIGESYGVAGLGLSGVGRGGGGTGQGSIGLGTLGTMGKGGGGGTGIGNGNGVGYGRGKERLYGLKGRRAVSTGAEVMGALDRSTIRSVIRRNQGAFQAAYESALKSDPSLGSRASVRFVIGADGQVKSASLSGEGMEGGALQMNVEKAVKGMQFPQPKGGGLVVVNYPLLFRAAGDAPISAADVKEKPGIAAEGDDKQPESTVETVAAAPVKTAAPGQKQESEGRDGTAAPGSSPNGGSVYNRAVGCNMTTRDNASQLPGLFLVALWLVLFTLRIRQRGSKRSL